MAKKTKSKAMEIATSVLRKNPRADFATVASACKRRGVKLIPIVYGRAKLALGLVKAGGKKRKAKKVSAKERSLQREVDAAKVIIDAAYGSPEQERAVEDAIEEAAADARSHVVPEPEPKRDPDGRAGLPGEAGFTPPGRDADPWIWINDIADIVRTPGAKKWHAAAIPILRAANRYIRLLNAASNIGD